MQTLRFSGLVLLEDRFTCDGERLLASLAISAANKKQFRDIRIVLLNAWKVAFEKRYPKLIELGVTVDEVESLMELIPSSSSNLDSSTALFVDSISESLQQPTSEAALRVLKVMTKRCPVIARVFAEDITESLRRRLHAIADVFLELSQLEDGSALCKLTYFKKTGKRVVKKQTFAIDDDLKIASFHYKGKMIGADEVEQVDSTAWELPSVPFDLGLKLSDSERLAKESVQLPFTAAQNENSLDISASGNRKVRAGGRVIYTPDEADDLDDSDPDEDLQI